MDIPTDHSPLTTDQKGIALIAVISLTAALLVMGLTLAKLVISDLQSANLQLDGVKAFYLAEAGIEFAKNKLNKDCHWFSDLPGKQVSFEWLTKEAAGHFPGGEQLGEGSFKIIRIKDQNKVYAVGSLKNKAGCIIELEFSLAPFKQISWEML